MPYDDTGQLICLSGADFYSSVHKGVRRALYRVSGRLSVADAKDEHSVTEAVADLQAVLDLAAALGTAEAREVHALLDRLRPGAAEAARLDGNRLAVAIQKLQRRADLLARARPAERVRALFELNARFSAFVGDALLHMADAEIELMPLLREAASEDELLALQQALAEGLGVKAISALVHETAPALSGRERERFWRMLRRVVTPELWTRLRGETADPADDLWVLGAI